MILKLSSVASEVIKEEDEIIKESAEDEMIKEEAEDEIGLFFEEDQKSNEDEPKSND
jgi:hypothetical protein